MSDIDEWIEDVHPAVRDEARHVAEHYDGDFHPDLPDSFRETKLAQIYLGVDGVSR